MHKALKLKSASATETFEASSPVSTVHSEGIKSVYTYWQNRILYSMIFGYASYYLVRQNFSMAIPSMIDDLGYTKADMGAIVSIWSIIYGIGKFLNGYISDRSNARYFMSAGLLGAALSSFIMGFGDGLIFFSILWGINAWFQSMGWPPVSRLITHWFSPAELGTKWGITNVSHQIGAAAIAILAGHYLIPMFGWRSAFFVPAVISIFFSFILFNRLRDTPKSLGLPSIETYEGLKKCDIKAEDDHLSTAEILSKIFKNKLLWCVCLGNMCLYIVRMGIFTWAPTFLKEFKGASLASSGWQVAGFELAGLAGGIAAGWISDNLFKGRRGPVSFFYMVGIIFFLLFFWWVPAGMSGLNAFAMCAVGFLVYGPQVLVGVAAADFASSKAVGMAVGLTGTFGYLGSAISGVCIGWVADHYGWDGGFIFFISAAILGCFFFSLTWAARSRALEKK